MLTVVKAGGAWLEGGPPESELTALAERPGDLVVVHGGGHEISRWQERCGLETEWADGLRVTRGDSVPLTSMVLSGWMNKGLASALHGAGRPSVGISGQDGGLIRAVPLDRERYGAVGRVDAVDTSLTNTLLSGGFTPVVSPVSEGPDGPLNVNADAAAVALASALGADRLLLISDVPGVLVDGSLLPFVDPDQAEELEETGHVTGGMQVKVDQAIEAAADVPEVFIGGSELLHELGQGTRVMGEAPAVVAGAA